MSFYATIQGEVQYSDDDSFNSMVARLKDRGHMDEEGFFLTESGDRVREKPEDNIPYSSDIDADTRSINIPCFCYRNLSRLDFFAYDGEKFQGKGTIIVTSTDGCFDGWEIVDGIQEYFDLTEWAAENMEDDEKFPPNKENFDSKDDWFQHYIEWQNRVECEFHSDGF